MCEDKILCIIDYRASENIIGFLKSLEIEVILTNKAFYDENPIDGHPDVVMSKLDTNTLLISPKHYDYYQKWLEPYHISLLKGTNIPEGHYPKDTFYNGLRTGQYYIHNLKYTDPSILEFIDERKLKTIDVKQAYSKCSVINLEENGIITADKGIYRACLDNGIDSLLVKEGQVDLRGYENGFIGGTSGYLNGKLYLTGSLEGFSDQQKVIEFLDKKKIELIQLSKDRLYDYGTLFMFNTGGINEEYLY
jgi:hypothetical protein